MEIRRRERRTNKNQFEIPSPSFGGICILLETSLWILTVLQIPNYLQLGEHKILHL